MERDLPDIPSHIGPAILPLGGIACFGGLAKIGKSFVLQEFAHALISGEVPFGCPELFIPRPVRVLLVEQELGEHGLRKRALGRWPAEEVRRLGRRFHNLFYASQIPDLQLDTPVGQKILKDLCDDVRPDVLILDPIGRFHNFNDNDNQQIERLFTILAELRHSQREQNMSILMSHHFAKPPREDRFGGLDPLDAYNFTGAAKWKNNPDTLMTIQRCAELAKPYEAWSLKVRFTLRHGSSLPDMIFHVNEHDDLRVRYVKHVGGMNNGRRALPKPESKAIEIKPQQGELLGFRAA